MICLASLLWAARCPFWALLGMAMSPWFLDALRLRQRQQEPRIHQRRSARTTDEKVFFSLNNVNTSVATTRELLRDEGFVALESHLFCRSLAFLDWPELRVAEQIRAEHWCGNSLQMAHWLVCNDVMVQGFAECVVNGKSVCFSWCN